MSTTTTNHQSPEAPTTSSLIYAVQGTDNGISGRLMTTGANLGKILGARGWTLRVGSGYLEEHFWEGAAYRKRELFLRKTKNDRHRWFRIEATVKDASKRAIQIAQEFSHEKRQRQGLSRKNGGIMVRRIFGPRLNTPIRMLIGCPATKRLESLGGFWALAQRICSSQDIPVFNLQQWSLDEILEAAELIEAGNQPDMSGYEAWTGEQARRRGLWREGFRKSGRCYSCKQLLPGRKKAQ